MSDSVRPHRRQPTRLPVPGILQARTLEWVAISFSNAWKWKVKVKTLSHVQLFATPWTAAHQAPPSMGFPRQEYWSGVPLPSPDGIIERPNLFFYFLKLFNKAFYFVLEYSQLATLWQSQVDSKGTQPYIYKRSFSSQFPSQFPSHPGCHIKQSSLC